jgi:flotillin
MVSETTVIAVIVFIFAIMAVVVVYAARYKKVPPDKAMVVYGRSMKTKKSDVAIGYRVISGGGKFILPIVEAVEFLPLDVRTLDVNVSDIVTDVATSGAKINIRSVTQVKVSSNRDALVTAAEHLLHKSNAEINEIAMKTLEGHVRGVCATMTIEAINSDRETISRNIQNQAAGDLMNMGIEIRSFVIKEIEDEHGYLDALGIKRTEEVKRDARIGKAIANREATIQEAIAAQEAEKANAEAEAQVALYHRDRDITRQLAEAEVEKERANKEIAFDIQDAKRQQEFIVEKRTIDLRDKEKSIEVQAAEVKRKEQEQAAEQVVPAEAHANAIAAEADGKKRVEVTLAEGERQKRILVAEGEKQNLSLTAEGQAHKILQEGTADADVIRLKGDGEASAIRAKGLAEADAIRAKGLAEAEAMEKKAAAWAKYGEAAIASLIIDALPEIAHEVSIPLLNTEKIIIMGEQGQSGLVNRSADIMAKLPHVVQGLTGQSITDLIGNISQAAGKGLNPSSEDGKKSQAGWEAVEEKS